MSIQLIRAFGPTIAKIKIPNEMVKALNDYVDGLIIDKKKSKELSAGANLAGDVTQEFKLEKEKKFDPEKVYKDQPNPTKI